MPDKIQTSIYKIKRCFEESYPNIVDELEKKGFTSQNVEENLSNNYTITLFYKKLSTESNWKDFIETIAQANQAIVNRVKCTRESFILFLINNVSNSIYAIAGGSGYASLTEFIDAEFGLNILSRLLSRESKSLRSTTEKNFFGGILGQIKYFRNDYNLLENDSFGSIYEELHSRLSSEEITEQFNIPQNERNSNYMCIAKDSFTIKRAIDFTELLNIVDKCEFLLTQPTVVTLNNYRKLTSSDSELIEKLDNFVIERIYSYYANDDEHIDINICHRNFEKYLSAESYILSFTLNNEPQQIVTDHPMSILNIIKAIRFFDPDLRPIIFKRIINYCHLESNSDGESITYDLLRNHFNIEILYEEQTYFLFNRDWYQVSRAFLDKINDRCQYYITNNTLNDNTLEAWTEQEMDENQYNAKYFFRQGFMVFDRITPQNIEMCDFLKYDETTVYLFHVKLGFDHSMRDLCNQVIVSARLINEDLKKDFGYIRLMYNSIKNYNGKDPYRLRVKKQLNGITEDQFLSFFIHKAIVYILAVKDRADNRNIQNIDEYNSNIAKFATQDLFSRMKDLGVALKIYQIQ
jgi:uncharacterized protein (TIGR04141 family)